jgi:hypothetical protein
MEKDGQIDLLTKKEALMLRRKKEKLLAYLGGLRNLKTSPDMLFVIDTVKEKIAVAEANRLKIPVVAPLDTNCDPDVVDFPIPGNDDAIRSVQLFCKEMCEAVNEGKELRAQDNPDAEGAEARAVTPKEKEELLGELSGEEESIDLTKEFGVAPVVESVIEETPKPKKVLKKAKEEKVEAVVEEIVEEVKEEVKPKAKKPAKKAEEAVEEKSEAEKPKKAVRKPKAAKEEE